MKRRTLPNAIRKGAAAVLFCFVLLAIAGWSGMPPSQGSELENQNSGDPIVGIRLMSEAPIQKTTAEIMADPAAQLTKMRMYRKGLKQPDRRNLPSPGGTFNSPQWPLPDPNQKPRTGAELFAPQTVGTQFDGATGPTETGAFPPDTDGGVGPTQFFVFLNGRLRTFNKTTGVADGVINADADVFWSSVMTPPLAGEVVFSTDPNVRFDRLSNRWFLNIIDVVMNASTGALTRPNRVLLAVCDAASNGTITGGTVWTFYQFQGDATLFTDYQSFGVDASAMYIGGNMFTLAGAFNSTKGFVIPKAPALTASPLTVWAFPGLVATSTGAGPFSPRGVDNYDPTNTGPAALGYFIGVDNATFNTLMIRRVTNPGSLGPAPTISANISVATPLATSFPVLVPHLGNTQGTGGRLDALDDRLYAAHMRNGRLWTAHNVGVNNTGVAGATNNRNACRWYELQSLSATPSVLQSGTLFDNNATNDANQRNYWIPSIMVSGQGHAALGCSIAGTNERVNAFTTGRLVGDALGVLRDGPGGVALPGYTASTTAYNPLGDPGGPSRRWGDYSFTSLDPKDDMTMWTIQEYCNGTNTYGVRTAKLMAPKPGIPDTVIPNAVAPLASVVVTVQDTNTTTSSSRFYDPGPDPAAPHTPFTHLSVAVNRVTGNGTVVVNSITYQTPTQFTLNLNTGSVTVASTFRIVVTNPDGQKDSSGAILTVDPALPIQLASFTGAYVKSGNVRLNWTTISEINNYGFEVQQSVDQSGSFETIAGSFVPGHGTTNEPQHYTYIHTAAGSGSRWYRLKQMDLDGTVNHTEPILVSSATTVSEPGAPAEFSLAQNYPNPFNPTTEIKFSVESSGQARLDIFNVAGQQVGTLFNETAIVGQYYKVKFDATNFPSGVYLYRLQSGTRSTSKKLVLLK